MGASSEEMNREPSAPTASVFAIRKALDALSEAQRQVLVLHFYEGHSFAEIGRVMGVKENAVKVRAHRGYRKLKELLASGEGEKSGVS
jgi:RNA polymerase sigma-70 factor (ECF subfamily)